MRGSSLPYSSLPPSFSLHLSPSLCLSTFASFSSGNDYVTGVYGQPRTGVTRIRSRFTQVARVEKQRRGRERECEGEREREREGWAEESGRTASLCLNEREGWG